MRRSETKRQGLINIFLGAQRIASIEHRGTSIETSYFHTNHLGSTDTITDDSGNKKVHYEYEPYGQVVQTNGTDSTDYKFTGKPLDDETGLYYYGARYYNPALGRFITPDSIIQDPTNPQSLNRYSYCGNNPVNRIDPSGHSWWSKFWKSFGSTVLSIVGVVLAPFTGGASLYLTYAATIWSGVQAAQAGQFGAWAAGFAISMALGGILPVGDFANPLMQIGAGALRGAAIGALSGGIASVIGGGSFGAGAAYGAMGGAQGGAISGFYSTQQFQNWKAGNGFRSNADVSGSGAKTPVGQQGQGSAKSALNTDTGSTASETQALNTEGNLKTPGFGENFGPGGYYDESGQFRVTIGPQETASVSQLNRLSGIFEAKSMLGKVDLFQKTVGIIQHFSGEDMGFLSDVVGATKIYSATNRASQVQIINYEKNHVQNILNGKSLFLLGE